MTREDVGETAGALTKQYGGRIHHIYDAAIRGFSVEMEKAGALRLARDPRVKLVEKDSVATVMGAQTGIEISWALDRIDQRAQPLDGVYNYAKTGAGVNAYVIDGGINYSQNGSAGTADLTGRLTHGFTVASNTAGPVYHDYFATVGNRKGHGTSVASILAGTLYGVAKGARIINVRIVPLDGPMTASNVIAGINRNGASPAKPRAGSGDSLSGGADYYSRRTGNHQRYRFRYRVRHTGTTAGIS